MLMALMTWHVMVTVVGSWSVMVMLGHLNSLESSKMGVIDMGLGSVEMRVGPVCSVKKI